jgi:hypothetical protein
MHVCTHRMHGDKTDKDHHRLPVAHCLFVQSFCTVLWAPAWQLTPTHYFPPLLPQLDNYPLTTTTVPHITIAPTSKQVTASI